MPRRLLPIGVLMAWMSAGLLILPAGAVDKPAPKEATTDADASVVIRDILFKGNSFVSDAQLTTKSHSPASPKSSTAANKSNEQPPARIGQIILTGNKRISSESILAHVPLFPGQILTYPDLQKVENALAELGVFVVDSASGVRPTITVLDSGSAYKDILITVKEKRTAGKPR
jgi:hypothetical protein